MRRNSDVKTGFFVSFLLSVVIFLCCTVSVLRLLKGIKLQGFHSFLKILESPGLFSFMSVIRGQGP